MSYNPFDQPEIGPEKHDLNSTLTLDDDDILNSSLGSSFITKPSEDLIELLLQKEKKIKELMLDKSKLKALLRKAKDMIEN